jgi:hypothetical protein
MTAYTKTKLFKNHGVPETPKNIQFPVQCVNGMHLVRYDWVALEDIDDKNCNMGRARTVKSTGVNHIENLIATKQYYPTLHEPPVVDQNGLLIAGKHRYDAHDGMNKTFMWCAICHFDNDDARNEYALDENMRKPFKTVADQDDFVVSVSRMVSRGIKVKGNKNSVATYIATQYPVLPMGWSSRTVLVEKIMEEAKIEYVSLEIMSDENIVKEYFKKFGIDILEKNSHHIIKKLTGKKDLKKSDRWLRLQRDLLDDISQGIDKTIIVTFTGANSENLQKLRKTCLDFKKDMITNALKLTTGNEKSGLGNVNFVFTKQLPADDIFNYVN